MMLGENDGNAPPARVDAVLAAEASVQEIVGGEPRFKFLTITQLVRLPFVPWRIVGVVPGRGLIVLYGQPGSGKTFAATELAIAIVRGARWHGRRVKQGNVIYIAAEGHLRSRIEAYLAHTGLRAEDLGGLRIVQQPVNLLDPDADLRELIDGLVALAKSTGPIALVIVDTLNRAMAGGDENSSEDMGRMVAAAQCIEDALGCAVCYVHHSGKDASKGARGHTSLKGATEAELEVTRRGKLRELVARKLREALDGEVLLAFKLTAVDLGPMSEVDPDAEDDERRTSCVVEPMTATPGAPRRRLTRQQATALEALERVLKAGSDSVPPEIRRQAGMGLYVRAATDARWRQEAERLGITAGNTDAAIRMAMKNARDGLGAAGVIGWYDGFVWLREGEQIGEVRQLTSA